MKTEIKQNFLYPTAELASAYKFGSGKIAGTILREDGDWRDYVPEVEHQNRNGVESSSCYVFGQQNAIATILEEQFAILNSNFSERFNALLSGGTPTGGNPIAGAQSIRHDGLIPDPLLPFSPEITSWEDFHSFEGGDEEICRKAGKEWLDNWKPNYDIVFERGEAVVDKYQKLREALRFSPCPISVYAWVEKNGEYEKPEGTRDTHLVEAVYLDDQNRIHVRDTYAPFNKVLAPWTNPDFAMRWSLTKLDAQAIKSLQERLIELLKKVVAYFTGEIKKVQEATHTPPTIPLLADAITSFEGWYPGSRSWRNNNPGNLRAGVGMTGMDGGFAVFPDVATGKQALIHQLTIIANGTSIVYNARAEDLGLVNCGELSILQMCEVYAPSSDNNSPRQYAEFLSKKVGVPVEYKLKQFI